MAKEKNTWAYPRLANYFLDSYVHPDEGQLLAAWDVLILSPSAQEWLPDVFQTIRQANPDIIILAYVSSTGVVNGDPDFEIYKPLAPSSLPDQWWLKSSQQQKLAYWPGATMLNPTDLSPLDDRGRRWNIWLPDWIADNIYSTGYWDGIFLDEAFPAISWLNNGDIDLNGDGLPEAKDAIDQAWTAGLEKITARLRQRLGPDGYIVVNGASNYTKYTNGRLQENVFRQGSDWPEKMNTYFNTYQASAYAPKLALLNSNTDNSGIINQQQFLFGLTSTLLGDGFYSYDHGDQKHFNIWWFDEYDIDLGQPVSTALNVTGPNDQGFRPGLWRRDFDKGTVLVNSTDKKLEYDISLHGQTASGALEPYSGDIITLDEFNQQLPDASPPATAPAKPAPPVTDKPSVATPPPVMAKPATETAPMEPDNPLYRDMPPTDVNLTSKSAPDTGRDFEVQVTSEIPPPEAATSAYTSDNLVRQIYLKVKKIAIRLLTEIKNLLKQI